MNNDELTFKNVAKAAPMDIKIGYIFSFIFFGLLFIASIIGGVIGTWMTASAWVHDASIFEINQGLIIIYGSAMMFTISGATLLYLVYVIGLTALIIMSAKSLADSLGDTKEDA